MKTIKHILVGVFVLLCIHFGYSQDRSITERTFTIQSTEKFTPLRLLKESGEILSHRMNCMSLRDFSVANDDAGSAQIIKITDTIETVHLKDLLTAPGKVNFYENSNRNDSLVPIFTQKSTRAIILEAHADFSDKMNPALCITLNEDLRTTFKEATKRNINKSISLVVDNKVIASPRVVDEIAGGQITMTGRGFSKTEVMKLAAIISSGELPVKLTIVSVK